MHARLDVNVGVSPVLAGNLNATVPLGVLGPCGSRRRRPFCAGRS